MHYLEHYPLLVQLALLVSEEDVITRSQTKKEKRGALSSVPLTLLQIGYFMIRYTINKVDNGGCTVQRDAPEDVSNYDELMAILMIMQTAYHEVDAKDDTRSVVWLEALKSAVNNNMFWDHARGKISVNAS